MSARTPRAGQPNQANGLKSADPTPLGSGSKTTYIQLSYDYPVIWLCYYKAVIWINSSTGHQLDQDFVQGCHTLSYPVHGGWDKYAPTVQVANANKLTNMAQNLALHHLYVSRQRWIDLDSILNAFVLYICILASGHNIYFFAICKLDTVQHKGLASH